jgi:uncharacterized Rmd1/YagE family protein
MYNGSELHTLCHAENYDFPRLSDALAGGDETLVAENVLRVRRGMHDIFVFDYGVVVFWGLSPHERDDFVALIRSHAHALLEKPVSDTFTYSLMADELAIKNDHLRIPGDDTMTRLAVSHAIAQSTKLSQFEEQVQKTIVDTAYIPRNIAEKGTSGLRRKQTNKLRGRLFLTKSQINLHYDLLDIPEFFWENPEFGSFYSTIADYLEIRQRVDVLTKKLETIHELFNMMVDEQKHKHSSLLEWIIIYLIAIDIFVIFVHDILKWV